jgi:hypothetical protein
MPSPDQQKFTGSAWLLKHSGKVPDGTGLHSSALFVSASLARRPEDKLMNISTLRTSIKGGNTAFGATALNERSRLIAESAKPQSGLTASLAETASPARVERNRGEPDPLIQALVDRLPKTDSIWSIDDRAKWLKAAAMAFNLIYKTE